MRYLDIAVAAMVGVSAITAMTVWSPRADDIASSRMSLQAHNRDLLVGFLESRGLPWILKAQPSQICSALAERLNGSAEVFASIGTSSCGLPAPAGSLVSNLTISLPTEVNIEAWVAV